MVSKVHFSIYACECVRRERGREREGEGERERERENGKTTDIRGTLSYVADVAESQREI